MPKANIGDYFKGYKPELLGDVDVYLEVVDYWQENGYCLREWKRSSLKDYYLTDEDIDRLKLEHSVKCVQVTFPDTPQKLIIPAQNFVREFDLEVYFPDFNYQEPGDKTVIEVILFPKMELDNLKEFEG